MILMLELEMVPLVEKIQVQEVMVQERKKEMIKREQTHREVLVLIP